MVLCTVCTAVSVPGAQAAITRGQQQQQRTRTISTGGGGDVPLAAGEDDDDDDNTPKPEDCVVIMPRSQCSYIYK